MKPQRCVCGVCVCVCVCVCTGVTEKEEFGTTALFYSMEETSQEVLH